MTKRIEGGSYLVDPTEKEGTTLFATSNEVEKIDMGFRLGDENANPATVLRRAMHPRMRRHTLRLRLNTQKHLRRVLSGGITRQERWQLGVSTRFPTLSKRDPAHIVAAVRTVAKPTMAQARAGNYRMGTSTSAACGSRSKLRRARSGASRDRTAGVGEGPHARPLRLCKIHQGRGRRSCRRLSGPEHGDRARIAGARHQPAPHRRLRRVRRTQVHAWVSRSGLGDRGLRRWVLGREGTATARFRAHAELRRFQTLGWRGRHHEGLAKGIIGDWWRSAFGPGRVSPPRRPMPRTPPATVSPPAGGRATSGFIGRHPRINAAVGEARAAGGKSAFGNPGQTIGRMAGAAIGHRHALAIGGAAGLAADNAPTAVSALHMTGVLHGKDDLQPPPRKLAARPSKMRKSVGGFISWPARAVAPPPSGRGGRRRYRQPGLVAHR